MLRGEASGHDVRVNFEFFESSLLYRLKEYKSIGMNLRKGFLFLCLLFSVGSQADPLGTLPIVEAEQLRFSIEGRSDLWLSPYEDKETPVRIYNAKLHAPFYEQDDFRAMIALQSEEVSAGRSDILVGQNDIPLGSSLRSQQVGLGLSYENESYHNFSFYGAMASSSDEPFNQSRDIWPELTATYFSPYSNSWRWMAFGNYSKSRGFWNNHFLPGVGAGYRLKESLEVMFGFPFLRVMWKPTLDSSTLFALSPVGARWDSSYIYSDSLLFTFSAGLSTRSYLHVNRSDEENRVIYEEKFIDIGFKRILSPKLYVGLKVGGSFDRSVYESKSVFKESGVEAQLGGDITGSFLLEFLP